MDDDDRRAAAPTAGAGAGVLALLLLTIGLRSLAGLWVADAFRDAAVWSIALAVSACAGKALGGIVADRVGWLSAVVPALVLSAILVGAGERSVLVTMVGLFLLQSATGVTLAALFCLLPERPATAFGLGSLALFVGALPVFLEIDLSGLARFRPAAAGAFVAALAAWWALALLRRGGPAAGSLR